jgi:hypothetical protein
MPCSLHRPASPLGRSATAPLVAAGCGGGGGASGSAPPSSSSSSAPQSAGGSQVTVDEAELHLAVSTASFASATMAPNRGGTNDGRN